MAAKSRLKQLNDLTISLGESVPQFSELKFRQQTAHIPLMFQRYLMEFSGYILDGSSSLHVHFGLPEHQREMLGPKYYFQDSRAQWSSCCIPKFNLKAFSALGEAAQDERTVSLLEKALLAVAKHVGADTKPIRDVAQRIRDDNFEAFVPDASKSAPHPRRAIEGVVCDHIARGRNGARWCVRLTDDAGRVLATEWVPENVGTTNPFFNYFARCMWKEDEFRFCRASGHVLYAANFARLFASNPVPERAQGTYRPALKPRPKPESKRRTGNEKLKEQMFKEVAEAFEALEKVMPELSRAVKKTKPPKGYFCPARPDRMFSAEELVKAARQFTELILVGDAKVAYQSLAKSQRRHVSQTEFRKIVIDFLSFADPHQNEGVTIERIRPFIEVRIEDPVETEMFAEQLPSDFPQDSIVCGLTAGGEVISRATLVLFAVCEGDSLKLAVHRAE